MPQGMLNLTSPARLKASRIPEALNRLAEEAGLPANVMSPVAKAIGAEQTDIDSRFQNEIRRIWEKLSGDLSVDEINALIDARLASNRPLTDLDFFYTWHHNDGQAFANAGTSTTSARISSHNIPGRLLVERIVWEGNSTAGQLQIAVYNRSGTLVTGTGTITNVNGRGSVSLSPGVQLEAGTYYVASSSVVLAGSGIWCTDPGPGQTGPVHRWGRISVTSGVLPGTIVLTNITRSPPLPQPLIELATATYASDS